MKKCQGLGHGKGDISHVSLFSYSVSGNGGSVCFPLQKGRQQFIQVAFDAAARRQLLVALVTEKVAVAAHIVGKAAVELRGYVGGQ